MPPSENENNSDDSHAEEALAEAAAIVDRGHQLLRHERTMRRFCRALQRLGLTEISGSWAHLDEDKAEIVFNPIQVDLMLVNRLEDLVELIETLQRVPAPVTVGGIHIHHVDQLQINYLFGTQPPTTD